MTKVQDPDLYKQLFAPHASEEDVKSSLETFMDTVQKARVEYGISDFVIAATANCSVDNETHSLVFFLARGDSQVSAELAAQLYNRFTLPEIQRAKHLEQLSRESVPETKEKE